MILYFAIALLFLPLEARYYNSPRSHLSDTLRLKCDSLLYRTTFVGTRCYFAVLEELKIEDANAKCAEIFPGAKVDTTAKKSIFNAMMVEKSRFHVGKDSSGAVVKLTGAKQSICMFDSKYTCDEGEPSPVMPGKCIAKGFWKRNFLMAEIHCKKRGMEVPSPANDLENRMIRATFTKDPVWLRNVYSGEVDRKWHRTTGFSGFGTCHINGFYTGYEMPTTTCRTGWGISSVMDNTGYWYQQGQGGHWDMLCVKNADNEFTKGEQPCIANHAYDKETGQCEWIGPRDACVQIIETKSNASMFVSMPDFPKKTILEHELINSFHDRISKVVVRRGCMYTGFASHIWYTPRNDELMEGNNNRLYGEYHVANYIVGDLWNWGDCISRLQCFCDPTEATVNGHVPGSSPDTKCVEHHVFNEATQACEWIHDSNYCAEIIHNDGRKQMLEIPDWPINKKLYAKEDKAFKTITDIIVRQHCWATLIKGLNFYDKRSLETAGYGKHQVASYHNSLTNSPDDGTVRIICECMR